VGTIINGRASFYGDGFDGKQTASGAIYDKNQLTAAHRTLPFGTRLRVTNLKNAKNVVVEVNDRGPFKDDRVLDLSEGAARVLDMINDGVIDVEIEIIQ
jgi:rare lipoprotein A